MSIVGDVVFWSIVKNIHIFDILDRISPLHFFNFKFIDSVSISNLFSYLFFLSSDVTKPEIAFTI